MTFDAILRNSIITIVLYLAIGTNNITGMPSLTENNAVSKTLPNVNADIKYPFLAMLKDDRDVNEKNHDCKTIIVSKSYVLTDRSCFDDNREYLYVESVNEDGNKLYVSEVIEYPLNNGSFNYCLVKLKKSFDFSSTVQPLVMFTRSNDDTFEGSLLITDVGKYDHRSNILGTRNVATGRSDGTGIVLFSKFENVYQLFKITESSDFDINNGEIASNVDRNDAIVPSFDKTMDKLKSVQLDKTWLKKVLGYDECMSIFIFKFVEMFFER